MIPTKEQNPDGLHQKYIISKVSGEPLDPGAEYFILRLDSGGDPDHVEACRAAIRAYAKNIQPVIPKLASDLIARYP